MNVNKALSIRIAQLLKEKNITQYRLAMNCGLTHSTLKNIMHGTIKDNLLSTVIIIAHGFNMTLSEFTNTDLFNIDNLNI